MSDDETRDYVDKVEKALQEKVSDASAKPERFIVSHNEEYIVSFPGLARFYLPFASTIKHWSGRSF